MVCTLTLNVKFQYFPGCGSELVNNIEGVGADNIIIGAFSATLDEDEIDCEEQLEDELTPGVEEERSRRDIFLSQIQIQSLFRTVHMKNINIRIVHKYKAHMLLNIFTGLSKVVSSPCAGCGNNVLRV